MQNLESRPMLTPDVKLMIMRFRMQSKNTYSYYCDTSALRHVSVAEWSKASALGADPARGAGSTPVGHIAKLLVVFFSFFCHIILYGTLYYGTHECVRTVLMPVPYDNFL